MRYRGLRILAIALLATACYAEPRAQQSPLTTPASPGAPSMQGPESPQKAMKEHRQARVSMTPALGAYLGVDPRDVTPDRTAVLKLNEPRGVEVMMVDRDSPAGKAGLKEHDVILAFNGKTVADADQLRRMLRDAQPGKAVPLTISRAGQNINLTVTLTRRPEQMAGMLPFPMPSMPTDFDIPSFQILQFSKRNGMMVEDLTPQLADFFGVKNGGGVLVRSIDRGSPADSAGLKAGDVIVKAGNDPISCSSDWGRILHQSHGSVPLAIVRDKHEQTLTLKLPDKGPDSSLHFDLPKLESQMQQLRAELASQWPEMERQVEIARADMQTQLRAHQKELEKAMKLQSQDIERAQQQARRALEKAMQDFNKE
jgi:serine protease Do